MQDPAIVIAFVLAMFCVLATLASIGAAGAIYFALTEPKTERTQNVVMAVAYALTAGAFWYLQWFASV